MRVIITTKNLDHSKILDDFIQKKFAVLKRYIDILKKDEVRKTLAEVSVNVKKETKHHKKGEIFLVKTHIVLPGKSLVATAKSEDVFLAVIKAKDEIKREIRKYKVKKIDKVRQQQRKVKKQLKKDGNIK
jgi:ribosomal subunit interface protein